eukprot:scaffold12549_cov75-Phaeocystis_antarctica.AAC.2
MDDRVVRTVVAERLEGHDEELAPPERLPPPSQLRRIHALCQLKVVPAFARATRPLPSIVLMRQERQLAQRVFLVAGHARQAPSIAVQALLLVVDRLPIHHDAVPPWAGRVLLIAAVLG